MPSPGALHPGLACGHSRQKRCIPVSGEQGGIQATADKLKQLIKLLHEFGAIGVVGSFAACILLSITAPAQPLIAYATARQQIAAITQWLLVPSLAVVLISGLLAIAANKAYINAGWAWLKALLGVSMFEGTLVTVAGSARHAAELSALALAGRPDPAQLSQVLRTEWGSLWLLLALSLANIVIAVWRPRLYPRFAR